MSCCNEADLNDLVCCCSGKTTALTLSVLFFLTGGSLAGSLIWQYYEIYDPEHVFTYEVAKMYLYMLAIPASFLMSTCGLCFLLACHKKFCMFLCILWPIAVSVIPGYFIYYTFDQYYASSAMLVQNASTVAKTNIVVFMLPICSVAGILLSVYCILMLCCLAMCARAEGGRDIGDIFDLENRASASETEDETEDVEECTKTPRIQ